MIPRADILMLKSMSLFQSGVMENHIFEGQEKCDLSEKSLRDENTELKQQILSLQKNLEEKDKKIKLIEAKLRSQMNSLHHASTQVFPSLENL